MTQIKVALTGRFRRGKDTVADMLAARIEKPVARLAFGDALKDELSQMVFGYLGESSPAFARRQSDAHGSSKYPQECVTLNAHLEWMRTSTRPVHGPGWQWWGEFRRRFCGEDYWISHPAFVEAYRRVCDYEHNAIVTDMRHFNEAEWCRVNGFYRIRVHGPCRAARDVRDPDHESERNIEWLPVDTVLYNEGSYSELERTVDGLVVFLKEWFTRREVQNNATGLSS